MCVCVCVCVTRVYTRRPRGLTNERTSMGVRVSIIYYNNNNSICILYIVCQRVDVSSSSLRRVCREGVM